MSVYSYILTFIKLDNIVFLLCFCIPSIYMCITVIVFNIFLQCYYIYTWWMWELLQMSNFVLKKLLTYLDACPSPWTDQYTLWECRICFCGGKGVNIAIKHVRLNIWNWYWGCGMQLCFSNANVCKGTNWSILCAIKHQSINLLL